MFIGTMKIPKSKRIERSFTLLSFFLFFCRFSAAKINGAVNIKRIYGTVLLYHA